MGYLLINPLPPEVMFSTKSVMITVLGFRKRVKIVGFFCILLLLRFTSSQKHRFGYFTAVERNRILWVSSTNYSMP